MTLDARQITRHILFFFFVSLVLPTLGLSPADAQALPGYLKEGRNSARSPVVKNGIVTFKILPGDCQSRSYGDGRGENDCLNKNSKSYFSAGEVRSGATMYYAFDVRVEGGLIHKAFHNPRMEPFTGGPDSRLSVAIWQGNLIKNHLVWLDLDKTRGLTFMGKTCAPAKALSQWTRFEMMVRWSKNDKGRMWVKCNGRTIYTIVDTATDQNVFCNISTHCEPGKKKNPRRINAGFGIFHDAEFTDRSIFPRLPKTGLVVQMRNFAVKKARF